jgi:NAD(P)-dependent dehydrogenase (short-subunit alcohol dehydrogenase family)
VNVVCPAAATPAADEYLAAHPEYRRELMREIPLGRLGDPERDIGRAVAALVSDDLAYLTGATLMLEGGRTLLG